MLGTVLGSKDNQVIYKQFVLKHKYILQGIEHRG